LATALLISWLNSTYVVTGRRDRETVNKEWQEMEDEIKNFDEKLEREKEELRRYLLHPTKEEIRDYLVLQLDGYSTWAYRVAWCESGFNPKAKSKYGRFYGLFQFWPSTFEAWSGGEENIWDWQAQTQAVKNMIGTLGFGNARRHWPICGLR